MHQHGIYKPNWYSSLVTNLRLASHSNHKPTEGGAVSSTRTARVSVPHNKVPINALPTELSKDSVAGGSTLLAAGTGVFNWLI